MDALKLVAPLLVTVGVATLVPGPAAAANSPELSARLGGGGEIFVVVEPRMSKLCFRLRLSGIEVPTSGYVHKHGTRRGSKRRVSLFTRRGGISQPTTKHCVKTRREKLLGRIANQPRKFDVNLYSPDPLNRGIRGRLRRVKGGFETGNFRDFDYWSVSHGSLSVTRERAYEGRRAARATNHAVGNQYQRVWYDVDWREGSNVWYGMALYIRGSRIGAGGTRSVGTTTRASAPPAT